MFVAHSTQLSMTEDGRLAVTKQSAGGPRAERLRREAEALRRAVHPGVVELVDADLEGDDGVVLRTAFVGGGTLAECLGTIDAARGTKVAAALTSTLADLHERGIAHQRLTPDHVLVTEDDQVQLCGFAEAVYRSDAAPCDPDVAAIDVEAVATIVQAIAESSPTDVASLQAVTGRVLGADPLARPSMRTLARALATLAGGADEAVPPVAQGRRLLPARPCPSGRRPRLPRGRARSAILVVVAVTSVSATAVLATTMSSPRSPSRPDAASSPASPPPDTGSPTTAASPPTTTSPEPEPVRVWPPDPEPRPETDPEVVEVASGVVSSSGGRWQVAPADDLVAVGDWNCDGLATPAVVRHGTGRIWVYTHWAEGIEAKLANDTTAPDAVSAEAVDDDGCHQLEVVDSAGKATRLDLAK